MKKFLKNIVEKLGFPSVNSTIVEYENDELWRYSETVPTQVINQIKKYTGSILLWDVTRIEVIDTEGRQYVRYLDADEFAQYVLQDDGRTLKMFIDKKD